MWSELQRQRFTIDFISVRPKCQNRRVKLPQTFGFSIFWNIGLKFDKIDASQFGRSLGFRYYNHRNVSF